MIFFPRTMIGWIALIAIVVLAVVIGGVVSPGSGAIGFGLLALIFGSTAIVLTEAWRADVWKGSTPPKPITPGQVFDYGLWLLRHRNDAK